MKRHSMLSRESVFPAQRVVLLLFALFLCLSPKAQVVDKIIAVVGEDVVLQSDVAAQYAYFLANGEKDDGTLRCQLLEKLLVDKLLLNKARLDSVEVSEDQVTSTLNRRIDYFIEGYQGVENLEKVYGKSLIEIKSDLRPDIKDQLLIEQMRQRIINKVKVTPKEVIEFYKAIPKDSLPLLPAEVILHQIVTKPQFSEAAKDAAKEKLEGIREEIILGRATFEDMASKYSNDFGSAQKKGFLGEFGRGKMVPQFEGVAFKLKEGQVSEVFETDYGYHIIKQHKRVGELITASHILISPRLTAEDDTLAVKRLKKYRQAIQKDSISFASAASEFSDDQQTKSNGGAITHPQSGEFRIPHDMLDGELYLQTDEMKPGEISQPTEFIGPDGKKAYRILYLKQRYDPHVANLEQDYQKIQQAATQAKQSQELERWFQVARKNVYIDIKDEECLNVLINWIQ